MAQLDSPNSFISFNYSDENAATVWINDRGDDLVWLVDGSDARSFHGHEAESVSKLADLRTGDEKVPSGLSRALHAFLKSQVASKIDRGFECLLVADRESADLAPGGWPLRDLHIAVSLLQGLRDAFHLEVSEEALALLVCEAFGFPCFAIALAAQLGSEFSVVARTSAAGLKRLAWPSQEMKETFLALSKDLKESSLIIPFPVSQEAALFDEVIESFLANDSHQVSRLFTKWLDGALRVPKASRPDLHEFR